MEAISRHFHNFHQPECALGHKRTLESIQCQMISKPALWIKWAPRVLRVLLGLKSQPAFTCLRLAVSLVEGFLEKYCLDV